MTRSAPVWTKRSSIGTLRQRVANDPLGLHSICRDRNFCHNGLGGITSQASCSLLGCFSTTLFAHLARLIIFLRISTRGSCLDGVDFSGSIQYNPLHTSITSCVFRPNRDYFERVEHRRHIEQVEREIPMDGLDHHGIS